jgi:leucyl-tRNA synthetase
MQFCASAPQESCSAACGGRADPDARHLRPHFAEESWERLGHQGSIFDARWPEWDKALVVEDQVEVVIQVSGKTRGRVSVPRDAEQGAVVAAAQEDAAVRRFTEGKEVRKVLYVPNRLLNLVVG